MKLVEFSIGADMQGFECAVGKSQVSGQFPGNTGIYAGVAIVPCTCGEPDCRGPQPAVLIGIEDGSGFSTFAMLSSRDCAALISKLIEKHNECVVLRQGAPSDGKLH